MRVLITGGAGFIGSHLVEQLQAKAQIRVIDNLTSGYRKNLERLDVEFVEGSIMDKDLLRQVMADVDYVFHLAAVVNVPESIVDPEPCVAVNTLGLLNVLDIASASADVKKLCFASSYTVYGPCPETPKAETMLPAPRSPYAISKLSGECYCNMFSEEGWLPTVAMRCFNVYGPRQDVNSPYSASIPTFIARALRNEPLQIFGDGKQTRDYTYVKDVVNAALHLTMNEEHTGVYNVASGTSVTIEDVARNIIDLTGSKSEIEFYPTSPGDIRTSRADVEKLKQTGFAPDTEFDEGIRLTTDFFAPIFKSQAQLDL